MAPIILGYWGIRGLGQPLRLMLQHSGLEWEDKLYIMTGTDPAVDKACWFDVKEKLGFDFPNLPWLVDGNVKLTQTTAIARYIARKVGLDGESDEEKRRVDLMVGEWNDFQGPFGDLCYDPNFNSIKEGYLLAVQTKLSRFSKFLGDKPWFAGDKLTYVDFLMYEMLDELKVLEPTLLAAWPNLEAYLARVEALPRIAEFMKSSKFIKYPLNNRHASFGG